LDPAAARAHHGRGLALARLGRDEEALEAYNRAIELDPGEARTHYNRACALALLGRTDDALRDLQRAIELESELREPARTNEDFERLQDTAAFRELVGPGDAPSSAGR
jgi:Flp pilus assembly protein TadD